jgi:hypothetical protein
MKSRRDNPFFMRPPFLAFCAFFSPYTSICAVFPQVRRDSKSNFETSIDTIPSGWALFHPPRVKSGMSSGAVTHPLNAAEAANAAAFQMRSLLVAMSIQCFYRY